jgi:hypothetical protein
MTLIITSDSSEDLLPFLFGLGFDGRVPITAE